MNHSLDAIFRPRSIAVVGASTRKGSLGREIFNKLLQCEFNGPVYPVNPNARFVNSVRAYPSISAIPDPVDLAVIVVRKDHVLNVVKECTRCGVKGLIVITAGFKETGEEGAALEREILSLCREHGIRMIGPNCMGVINTDPEIRLDTTFAPTISLRGNLGFVSQSGALGQTILEHANALNLGVSMFVSVGNKADVSGNDLLEYWRDDPSVQVILMYLESFGNPRKFFRLAQQVSQKKPIVVVKSGRTSSGARAASSHTGALAGMDIAFDALFKQCGVIRANTIEEMFEIAMGLAHQPLPRGNRVAIITNAGGPAIMAADACESLGLQVAPLSEQTRSRLRQQLNPDAIVNNPVDLLAGAQPEDFQFTLSRVLEDPHVDAAIVIFVAPIITDPIQVAQKIIAVTAQHDKPVLGCFMGVKGVATGVEELKRHRIPTYAFPESAARTLVAMVKYSHWRQKSISSVSRFPVAKSETAEVLKKALEEKREQLTINEITSILKNYGIPFVQSHVSKDLNELLRHASTMKSPMVLKIASKHIQHKTDVGGVKLDLQTAEEVQEAYFEIVESLKGRKIDLEQVDFVLQEMVEGGRETILGITAVRGLGSLIMFGLGGIYVEVIKDVSFRIVPLTDSDAEEMIQEIKALPILKGVRGAPPVDFSYLKEILLRLSQLAFDFPQIEELDINPFLVFPDKKMFRGVDARMRIKIK